MKKIIYLIGALYLIFNSGLAQNSTLKPIVKKPIYFDVSPPFRDLALEPNTRPDLSWRRRGCKKPSLSERITAPEFSQCNQQ